MSPGSAWARWINVVRRRLRVLFRNRTLRREIEEELRAHVEMEAEALRERGMGEEEARRAALLAFGGVERTLESGHEAWGGRGMQEWMREHALAARTLLRRPLWSATAVLTLALGIGSVTALFSLVDAVLLAPLPFVDAGRLELVGMRRPGTSDGTIGPMSPLDLGDFRARTRAYSSLAAFSTGPLTLRLDDLDPAQVAHTLVTGDFFPTLGQLPAVGRLLDPGDGERGAPRVAVLSHDFWTRRFGADPAVVGRSVRLGDEDATIVGVTRPGLVLPRGTDVWSNYAYGFGIGARHARWLQAVGRIAPGATPADAHEELAALARQLAAEHPASNEGWGVVTRSVSEALLGGVRPALLVLFGSTGLILLLALSNVGGLIVSRSEVREREFALRGALGAGRGDVLRQLLAEANVLALVASAVGLAVATGIVVGLRTLAAPDIPRLDEATVGLPGLGFMILAAAPVVVALTALPARRLVRGTAALDPGHAAADVRAGRGFVKRGLVGVQVALSTVLLVGAVLLARSFRNVLAEDPGFDPDDVVAVRVDLPAARYASLDAVTAFHAAFSESARSAPGIVGASVASSLPLGDPDDPSLEYTVVDRASGAEEAPLAARYRKVGPDFFATVGGEIVRGRGPSEADGPDAPGVAVVNERLAEQTFPGEDPVGRRLALTAGNFGARSAILVREVEIVGIARDIRFASPREEAEPAIFLGHRQAPFASMYLLARIDVPVPDALATLRGRLRTLDPDLFIGEVVPLGGLYAASVARERFLMLVLTAFSSVALALSVVGVVGIAASSVTRRSAEMAVRQALGAAPHEVLATLLADLLGLVVAGALIGVAAAALLSGTLAGLLYGVSPTDPLTLATTTGVVVVVALGAGTAAAGRILAVDPARTLRTS